MGPRTGGEERVVGGVRCRPAVLAGYSLFGRSDPLHLRHLEGVQRGVLLRQNIRSREEVDGVGGAPTVTAIAARGRGDVLGGATSTGGRSDVSGTRRTTGLSPRAETAVEGRREPVRVLEHLEFDRAAQGRTGEGDDEDRDREVQPQGRDRAGNRAGPRQADGRGVAG
jgi:hypothetical protein